MEVVDCSIRATLFFVVITVQRTFPYFPTVKLNATMLFKQVYRKEILNYSRDASNKKQ